MKKHISISIRSTNALPRNIPVVASITSAAFGSNEGISSRTQRPITASIPATGSTLANAINHI